MNTKKSSVRLATYTTVHSAIDRLRNDGEKKMALLMYSEEVSSAPPPSGPISRDPGRVIWNGPTLVRTTYHGDTWVLYLFLSVLSGPIEGAGNVDGTG